MGWSGLVRRLSYFLAVFLSLGLGGCFVSSNALISPRAADHPWAASRGQHFDWEDGKWKLRGAVSLSRDGAYYVLKSDESGETTRFLVHRIDPGHYIAQAEDSSDKAHPSYIYGLIVSRGAASTNTASTINRANAASPASMPRRCG